MSLDARSEIIETINLYGLAVDARRWDLFDRIFTPDVEADYTNGRRWTDLPTFTADFAVAHQRFRHTQHAMSNHLVRMQGDAATAFSYVAFRLVSRGDDGDDVQEGAACYDDSLVRVAGRWLIGRRHCRITWRRRFCLPAEEIALREAELATQQVEQLAADGALAFLAAEG